MTTGKDTFIPDIVEGKKSQPYVDNVDTDPAGIPASMEYKRYNQIPPSEAQADSFICACVQRKGILTPLKISPFMLDEIRSVISMSTFLHKEMAIALICDTAGTVYASEKHNLGYEDEIAGNYLSPYFDMPANCNQIMNLHTHVARTAIGLVGFSFIVDDIGIASGDWMQIIEHGDHFISIVTDTHGSSIIAYRSPGSYDRVVREYFKAEDPQKLVHSSLETLRELYLDQMLGENGRLCRPDFSIEPTMGDDTRIERNIKVAQAFGFSLFQLDNASGQIKRLS